MGVPLAERSPNHRSTALRHSQSARPRAVTSPHRARPPPQGPAPSQRAGPTPPPTCHTTPSSQEDTPPRGPDTTTPTTRTTRATQEAQRRYVPHLNRTHTRHLQQSVHKQEHPVCCSE